MKKISIILAGCMVLATSNAWANGSVELPSAGAATPVAMGTELSNDGSAAVVGEAESTMASSLVQSNAKLALYFKPGNIVRSKGVYSVTNPSKGIYCVLPKSGTGINVAEVIPILTVEYGHSFVSAGKGLYAYYRDSALDCPATTLEVMTFSNNNGYPVLNNGIAFNMIVQ